MLTGAKSWFLRYFRRSLTRKQVVLRLAIYLICELPNFLATTPGLTGHFPGEHVYSDQGTWSEDLLISTNY